MGIAFQENLLLNTSIRENIAYGNKNVSSEKVIQAAKTSHAHDFIKKFPRQYETIVGERGTSLSGGERQRLAIARAMIADPEILILDEATSFLEVEQEEVILKSIKELRRDKITIIISHRMSAMRMADRILTLDNGRVLDIQPANEF
jgi:subfamily B ATP-binding cassette protein HlyB/CyaB